MKRVVFPVAASSSSSFDTKARCSEFIATALEGCVQSRARAVCALAWCGDGDSDEAGDRGRYSDVAAVTQYVGVVGRGRRGRATAGDLSAQRWLMRVSLVMLHTTLFALGVHSRVVAHRDGAVLQWNVSSGKLVRRSTGLSGVAVRLSVLRKSVSLLHFCWIISTSYRVCVCQFHVEVSTRCRELVTRHSVLPVREQHQGRRPATRVLQ